MFVFHKKFLVFYVFCFFCVIYCVFNVKYSVQQLQNERIKIKKEIKKSEENFHILNVEWEYLTSPKKLEGYVKKYFPNFAAITAKRIITFDQLRPFNIPVLQEKYKHPHSTNPQKNAKENDSLEHILDEVFEE
jgi:hypothetical protein